MSLNGYAATMAWPSDFRHALPIDSGLGGYDTDDCGRIAMRPYKRYAMTVQRDAAGVWGVPRFSFISPQDWG